MALVTGAARRIGRVIALELAAAGWDLAVHCRASQADAEATAAELQRTGARAVVLQADLADESACAALVPRVVAALGRIDAVVNNASLFEHDTVHDFGFGAMDRHWRANTGAPIVLARALHAAVSAPGHATGRGCVVNLLDQKLWNPNPDHLSYTLSKAALQTATMLLAQALAPHVRVVGVAPGLTLHSGDMNDAEFNAAHALTPLGRSSDAGDVARAVRYLLDAGAVTGTTLLVDGGQHLQPLARDVLFSMRATEDHT